MWETKKSNPEDWLPDCFFVFQRRLELKPALFGG